MGTLSLVGNLIEDALPWNTFTDYGHLQLVYSEGENQKEIEVKGQNLLKWDYRPVEEHIPGSDPEKYKDAPIDLGAERSAEAAWRVLKQAHEQFTDDGEDISYGLEQNSNSYARTLLSIIGLDDQKINSLGAEAKPGAVAEFPGFSNNVLLDPDDAISLKLYGTKGRDVIQTGVMNDQLYGGKGNDELLGGGGADYISGNAGADMLFGGAGVDTFVASSGSDLIMDFEPGVDKFRFPKNGVIAGSYDEMGRSTEITYKGGSLTLHKVDLRPYGDAYPRITWKDGDADDGTSSPPRITSYDTFQEDDLIFLRLNYTDPDSDAEGFGFRGAKGSGWAEETHPFSDPSYGRVSEGTIAYPFNHRATTEDAFESDVEAWIYDKEGLRSDPVTVHLAGNFSELEPIGGTAM